MLLFARYAHSATINLTYVKFAFPLFQVKLLLAKRVLSSILVKKRALRRNIYSIPKSTQPINNFN